MCRLAASPYTRRSFSPRILGNLRRPALLILGLGAVLVAPLPSAAVVTIDWVQVGNPGNAADASLNCFSPNCGSVPYTYYISKYDTTDAQYAEFLNAVDPGGSNSLSLYDTRMSTDTNNGGISLVSGNPSRSTW
jgi:formylglycine-generating enzyme